jgi:hypothetical protein
MLWQSSLANVIKNVDPELPVAQVRSMDQLRELVGFLARDGRCYCSAGSR